jgi:hypothetical protein
MGTELKDGKTLKGAIAAAQAELAAKRKELAKAEETRMFAAVAAEKGFAKEKQALRAVEDAVAQLREELAIAERDVRQREIEYERVLVHGEELDGAAYARWTKEVRARVAKDGALLRENQEAGILILKRMAADTLEYERRIPKKLVARRCNRTITVEVLDEGMQAHYGKTTRMPFFNARKEADAGRVRIVPDEKLTLEPSDFEYEERSPPLPADLEAVRHAHLGRFFGESDMRKEITFDAIVLLLEEDEETKAAKTAAGRKS